MRILLVEDDRSLSRAVSTILQKNNYSVDCVENGQTALDYLEKDIYDAVIMDIMMPRINGIEVLKQMRSRNNTTPVLLLTARDGIGDRVNGLDAGHSEGELHDQCGLRRGERDLHRLRRRLHRLDDAPSFPRAAARRHAPLAGAEQLRGRTHGRRHPPGPREPAARAGAAAERQSLRGATGLRGLRHRRQRHSPQVRGGGGGGRCGRGALHRGDGGRVRTLPQGVPAHRDEGFADNDNNGGDAAAGERGGDAELRGVPGGVSVRGAALLAGGAGRGGDLDDLRYR